MSHQPAISFSISFHFIFNRAGGRTSNVGQEMKTPNQRIEFTDDGFVFHKRRWLWCWTRQPVKWSSVASISAVMWDCFSCHTFGYRLILSDGTSICMTDLDNRWDQFHESLRTVYPDIDPEIVGQVELAFPGEIELTCWKKEEAQQDAPSNRQEPLCLPAFMITTTSTPRSTLALAPSGG